METTTTKKKKENLFYSLQPTLYVIDFSQIEREEEKSFHNVCMCVCVCLKLFFNTLKQYTKTIRW